MGSGMKLRELLRLRRDWSEEDTIYVAEPWGGDADALLSSETPDATDPIIQAGKSYAYFLEGFIARDFLDDLGAPDDVGEAVCDRLIRFAIDDA
jgi:hypothetical protein